MGEPSVAASGGEPLLGAVAGRPGRTTDLHVEASPEGLHGTPLAGIADSGNSFVQSHYRSEQKQ